MDVVSTNTLYEVTTLLLSPSCSSDVSTLFLSCAGDQCEQRICGVGLEPQPVWQSSFGLHRQVSPHRYTHISGVDLSYLSCFSDSCVLVYVIMLMYQGIISHHLLILVSLRCYNCKTKSC